MMINGVSNNSIGALINNFYVEKRYGISSDEDKPIFSAGENQETREENRFKLNKSKDGKGADGLTDKEREEVKKLKETDKKVRQHEQAHMAAGAGLIISGAQFEYKRGPDGQLYAVSGEVTIDTSEVPNNPEATLEKAKKIQRAALAPQDPSPQDRQVAAKARQMENKARMEIMKEKQEQMKKAINNNGTSTVNDFRFQNNISPSHPDINMIKNPYSSNQSFSSNLIDISV